VLEDHTGDTLDLSSRERIAAAIQASQPHSAHERRA